jgi:hypothetical protein
MMAFVRALTSLLFASSKEWWVKTASNSRKRLRDKLLRMSKASSKSRHGFLVAASTPAGSGG